MDTKVLALLALVSVVRSNDVIVGLKTDGRKFFDENRQANPAIWRQMTNVTITAPENEVISRIVITDLRPEKDGDVKVVEGGEGEKNVTIELKSPTVLRGYDFHIEVFSSPNGNIHSKEPQSTTENVQDESSKTTDQNSSNNPGAISKLPDSSTHPNVPAILTKDEENMENARQGRNAKHEDTSTEGTTEITSTTFSNDLSTTQSTESVTENHSDKTSEFNTQDHKYPVSPIPLNRDIKIGPYVPIVTGSDTNNKDNRETKDETRHTRDTEAEKSLKSMDNKPLLPGNLHIFESSTENNKELSTTEVNAAKPVEEKSADNDKEDNLNAPKVIANDYHKFTSIIPSKVEHLGKPITEDAEKLRNARDINQGEKAIEYGTTMESAEITTANFKDAETTTLSSDECVTSGPQENANSQNPLTPAGNQATRGMVYLNDREWNGRFNNPRFQSQDSGENNEKSRDNVNIPVESEQPAITADTESLGNSYRPTPDHMENKNPKISAIAGLRWKNEPASFTQ